MEPESFGITIDSVDLTVTSVKNSQRRDSRNRTFSPNRPARPDRRVRRTTESLQEAVLSLAHEKPFGSIAVKEILERANVGRSAFYTHFRDKGDLLERGLYESLRAVQQQSRSIDVAERLLGFSLPLLKHVDDHRHAHAAKMTRTGRFILHKHLQRVVATLVLEGLAADQPTTGTPVELLARHVASTFVLVLNWWVESQSALSAADADARFRDLVVPVLAGQLKRRRS
jgi:AcrR family transcriptional regulator